VPNKDSSRIRGDAQARKDQKRIEAAERHAHYQSLSPESRMVLVEARPGSSEKERKKLLSAIESRAKVGKK
jgi:hypothetical protein